MGFFDGGGSTTSSNFGSDASSFSGLAPALIPTWQEQLRGYRQGIAPWQQNAFSQALQSAMSNFSGLNAAKGGLTPGMLPQIASNAAQQVAPQFALANSQSMDNLFGMRQVSQSKQHSFGSSFGQTEAPGIGYGWSQQIIPATATVLGGRGGGVKG